MTYAPLPENAAERRVLNVVGVLHWLAHCAHPTYTHDYAPRLVRDGTPPEARSWRKSQRGLNHTSSAGYELPNHSFIWEKISLVKVTVAVISNQAYIMILRRVKGDTPYPVSSNVIMVRA
jgi:hypothetical protein